MHVKKIKAGSVNTKVENFVGELGTIFYDHHTGILRISDGHTPGGKLINVPGTSGPRGPQGIPGPQGIQGEVGPQGIQGAPGVQGDMGPQGPIGNTGTQGAQGVPGQQGIQGVPGAKGDQGLQGNTGTQGIQGPVGDTGAQGISLVLIGSTDTVSVATVGPGQPGQGWIGTSTGHVYFWNTLTTRWEDIGPIVGPAGPRGPQGVPGAKGDQGIQGNTGTQGAQGVPGQQGIQGVPGAKGDQGIQGPPGPQGSTGTQGIQGIPGVAGQGVPTGGSTGQVLSKIDSSDYNTQWIDNNPFDQSLNTNNNVQFNNTLLTGTLTFDNLGSKITEARSSDGYSYSYIATTDLTGPGVGCQISVQYNPGDIIYPSVGVNDGGAGGYAIGDHLKVTGDLIGGKTPDNDLVVEVTALYPNSTVAYDVAYVSGTPPTYFDGLHVRSGGYEWTFDQSGVFHIPRNNNTGIMFADGTFQTTAAIGGGATDRLISGSAQAVLDTTGKFNLGPAQNQAGTYTNVVIQADSNVDSFAQIIHQNHSTGTNASTDIVLMNSAGDDFNNFIDLGINSTNYSQIEYSVTGPGDGYLFVNGADLVLGTQSPNRKIKFHAGGTKSDDAVAEFDQYRFYSNRRMEISVGTPSALTFLSRNTSNNVEASSSFVAENNNGDYIKMGVNSSQRVDGSINPNESFIYTSQTAGTMHIGNRSSINFYANATNGYLETPTVRIDNTTSNVIFDGDVIPYGNNVYNLGSPTHQWNHIYVNTGSIYLGGIKLSTDNNQLSVQQVTNIGGNETVVQNYALANADRLVNGSYSAILDSAGDLTVPHYINGAPNLDLRLKSFGDGRGVRLQARLLDGSRKSQLEVYTDSVNIRTNESSTNPSMPDRFLWQFRNDGALTFPDLGTIDDNDGIFRVKSNDMAVQLGSSDDQNYVTVNTSTVTIQTQADTTDHNWTFENDGKLRLAGDAVALNGRFIQDVSTTRTSMRWVNAVSSNGIDIQMVRVYRDGGTPYDNSEQQERVQLGYVDVEENVSAYYISTTKNPFGRGINPADDVRWEFQGTGDIKFPDATLQFTAWQGAIIASATAPADAKGRLWLNTEDGRVYHLYEQQWIELNAPVVPPASIYTGDLSIESTRISNLDYTGSKDVEIENADKVWKFTGQGSVVFPDNTIQTTAYPGVDQLVIDGGNASTWA